MGSGGPLGIAISVQDGVTNWKLFGATVEACIEAGACAQPVDVAPVGIACSAAIRGGGISGAATGGQAGVGAVGCTHVRAWVEDGAATVFGAEAGVGAVTTAALRGAA